MTAGTDREQDTDASGSDAHARQWRCRNCGKVMGQLFQRRVHLRPRGGHTYYSPYPVKGVCNRCGCTNQIRSLVAR